MNSGVDSGGWEGIGQKDEDVFIYPDKEDAMDNRYIMTAFGQDRPGIVADVTKLLFENGCNLEETSMTLLADEFTLILLFTSQNREIEELLQRECRRLERDTGRSPQEPRRFHSFTDLTQSVREQVAAIRAHPWILPETVVRGFFYDVGDGSRNPCVARRGEDGHDVAQALLLRSIAQRGRPIGHADDDDRPSSCRLAHFRHGRRDRHSLAHESCERGRVRRTRRATRADCVRQRVHT